MRERLNFSDWTAGAKILAGAGLLSFVLLLAPRATQDASCESAAAKVSQPCATETDAGSAPESEGVAPGDPIGEAAAEQYSETGLQSAESGLLKAYVQYQADVCVSLAEPSDAEALETYSATVQSAEIPTRSPTAKAPCVDDSELTVGATVVVLATQNGRVYVTQAEPNLAGWVSPDVLGVAADEVPTSASQNLALLKSTQHRNQNHDNSAHRNTRSADLPIDDLLVSWRDYEAAGGITSVIEGSGAFRVECEFSHFAYDDPIVLPGQPGVAHLHMFFGNTDANAFSTADSLLDSGSSTCNGAELNRTSYWVPAMIDADGNVAVPDNLLVYYKAYASASGATEIYPDGMQLVSGNAMATAPQPGTNGFRELFFRCYYPGTPSDFSPRYVEIPSCEPGTRLEMNIKFQTCWNGQNPGDYKSNASYSNVWPTSGECPASHPRHLPQMEYRIFFDDHAGSANWILSSDVSMADQTTVTGHGYSLHGDWFGAWNKTINQRWIDSCVNIINSDCDEGLLADPRRDTNAQALQIRPNYQGPTRIPGDELLRDLCPVDKAFTGQASVAYCLPDN